MREERDKKKEARGEIFVERAGEKVSKQFSRKKNAGGE